MRGYKLLLVLVFMILTRCNNYVELGQEDVVTYYSNDSIEWKGQLIGSLKSGVWTLFDSLGNIDIKYHYRNDTLFYREYYRNNAVYIKEELLDENTKHGQTVVYYPNGLTESISNFVKNKQYGEQIFYFNNGQVKLKYTEDSAGIKYLKQYHSNGKLFAESKDPKNGITTFYDSLGVKKFDIQYADYAVKDTINAY